MEPESSDPKTISSFKGRPDEVLAWIVLARLHRAPCLSRRALAKATRLRTRALDKIIWALRSAGLVSENTTCGLAVTSAAEQKLEEHRLLRDERCLSHIREIGEDITKLAAAIERRRTDA